MNKKRARTIRRQKEKLERVSKSLPNLIEWHKWYLNTRHLRIKALKDN